MHSLFYHSAVKSPEVDIGGRILRCVQVDLGSVYDYDCDLGQYPQVCRHHFSSSVSLF